MFKKDYWGGVLGGLILMVIGRVLYNNHMDSLPHKYTITQKIEPAGTNIRFTYVVGRKTYEGKLSGRSCNRICWDYKYVVSYAVDDPNWSIIIRDHPIPDSVASLIIPGVFPEMPVEWKGGQIVAKEKYLEYVLSE
jgi:hypothetical protein